MLYDPHTMNEDNYNDGYQAYQDKLSLDDNPFEDGTEAYSEWETGWVVASSDDNDPF